MSDDATPGNVPLSDQLGPVPKRAAMRPLEVEFVRGTLHLNGKPAQEWIDLADSFRVEQLEEELRERLEEVRLMKMTVDNLEARIAMERQQQRDACASAAWIHYMDVCKARGLAPSEHEHWNAARAVRGA